MQPASQVLEVWKGNTKTFPLRFKTKVGSVVTPINLTGCTLVYRAVWPDGALRKEGVGQGFPITDPANGEAELIFSVADTRALPTGSKAKYEVEVRSADEQVTRLYGHMNVSEWANDD
jgi:hypothetical protein